MFSAMPSETVKWICWKCREENESDSERVVFMEWMGGARSRREPEKTKKKVFNCTKCGEANTVKIPV